MIIERGRDVEGNDYDLM